MKITNFSQLKIVEPAIYDPRSAAYAFVDAIEDAKKLVKIGGCYKEKHMSAILFRGKPLMLQFSVIDDQWWNQGFNSDDWWYSLNDCIASWAIIERPAIVRKDHYESDWVGFEGDCLSSSHSAGVWVVTMDVEEARKEKPFSADDFSILQF